MTSTRGLVMVLVLGVCACPEQTPEVGDATGRADAGPGEPVALGAQADAGDAAAPDATTTAVLDATTTAVLDATTTGLVTYALDLTAVRQPFVGAPGGELVGTPTFSHNSHAIFSINLATTTTRVERLSWETVMKVQGKGTCHDFPEDRAYVPDAERGSQALRPYDPDDALKGFRSPYRVRLRGLDLHMPYRGADDEYVRIAGPVCVAVRTGDGTWRWRTSRVRPVQDTAGEVATAHVDLDVDDVDAVAVRFEHNTRVAFIRYTIERTSASPPALAPGDLATAGCCSACAPDGPDLASRYCCTSGAPSPEPCTEERSAISTQCRPPRDLYDEAAAACRAKSLWLRDYALMDPDNVCTAPDRLTTGVRGVSFKCCRDRHFVPAPPEGPGSPPDCQLVGGLATPCASNAAMLARQVEVCFQGGLIHRQTIFGNECPGVGSSSVTSVCCRRGVPGPAVSACTM